MEALALLLAAVCPYGHEEPIAVDKDAYLSGLEGDKYYEEVSGQPLPIVEVRADLDREIELMRASRSSRRSVA